MVTAVELAAQPRCGLSGVQNEIALDGCGIAIIEIGRATDRSCTTVGKNLDEVEAVVVVLDDEQETELGAEVVIVDEDGALLQSGVKVIDGGIDERLEHWVAGSNEFGVLVGAIFFGEANELNGRNLIAERARDVSDLETTVAARIERAAEHFESGLEKVLDGIGLELDGEVAIHVLNDAGDGFAVESIFSQGALVEESADVLSVEGLMHDERQALCLVGVTDGVEDEFAQGLVVERNFAEDVEDLAAEGLAFVVDFFEEGVEDLTFAGVDGDEVPKAAGF